MAASASILPLRRSPLRDARSIAALAVDGMSPFHLSAPLLVFATRVGFGSAVSLRQHFGRQYGVSPQAYRRQFQAPAQRRQLSR